MSCMVQPQPVARFYLHLHNCKMFTARNRFFKRRKAVAIGFWKSNRRHIAGAARSLRGEITSAAGRRSTVPGGPRVRTIPVDHRLAPHTELQAMLFVIEQHTDGRISQKFRNFRTSDIGMKTELFISRPDTPQYYCSQGRRIARNSTNHWQVKFISRGFAGILQSCPTICLYRIKRAVSILPLGC